MAAIDNLIAKSRAAPMIEELEEAINEARVRRIHSQARGIGGFWETLREAEKNNKTADPEHAKACTKMLEDKLKGNLTRDQFLQGCEMMDTAAKIYSSQPKEKIVSHAEKALGEKE